MAKSKTQKSEALQTLVENMKASKSMVFANYQGLKMTESEELRKLCRDGQVVYMSSKKTLVQKALSEAGFADTHVQDFDGAVAVAFGTVDEVAPAQIIAGFAKKHTTVKIFGGVLEGAFIDGAKVAALSQLPSKQQLLGQLVGTLNAPVSGFVNVLAGNIRGFVTVLNAIKDQKPA
jgi:large subunit ribosomal protein L10